MTPCIYAGCERPAQVWPDGLRACGHHRSLCDQGPAGLETIAVEQASITASSGGQRLNVTVMQASLFDATSEAAG